MSVLVEELNDEKNRDVFLMVGQIPGLYPDPIIASTINHKERAAFYPCIFKRFAYKGDGGGTPPRSAATVMATINKSKVSEIVENVAFLNVSMGIGNIEINDFITQLSVASKVVVTSEFESKLDAEFQ